MSAATLLDLAKIISKDPNNNKYTDTQKYRMLSAGQEAIVTLIDIEYLDLLKKLKSHTSIASPGTFTLESDFLRHAYFSFSDGVTEIEYIHVEDKGLLRNSIRGGTDLQPIWYTYLDNFNVLKGKVLLSTYSLLDNAEQYYIRKPPEIGGGQEPILIGYDAHILAYFKHLLHLMEGQADLATSSYQVFLSMLEPFIKRPLDDNERSL